MPKLGTRSLDELAAPDRQALAPFRHARRLPRAQCRLDPLRVRLRQSRQALDAQDLGERGTIHDAVACRRYGSGTDFGLSSRKRPALEQSTNSQNSVPSTASPRTIRLIE